MAMDYAKYIGRIGVLAVALGIGYGISPATASADPDSTGTESSSPAESAPARTQHRLEGVAGAFE